MAKSDLVKPKKQIDRFRETARELETNEDQAAFDKALKRVAKASQPKPKKAAK